MRRLTHRRTGPGTSRSPRTRRSVFLRMRARRGSATTLLSCSGRASGCRAPLAALVLDVQPAGRSHCAPGGNARLRPAGAALAGIGLSLRALTGGGVEERPQAAEPHVARERQDRAAVQGARRSRGRGVQDRWSEVHVADERLVVRPRGIPGPRISSGTCVEGSYGTIFPCGIRCSPCMKPWSEVKITYVLSSSPVSRSVSTIASTPRSTAGSDAQRSRIRLRIASSRLELMARFRPTQRGLSDTSSL